MIKHYAYCMTINNPKMTDLDALTRLRCDSSLLAHIVIGHEGYSYGRTPHEQIAVCFKKKMSWKEVKNLFPRAHIEPLRYDYGLAVAYCEKEGLFIHEGSMDEAKKLIFQDLMKKASRHQPKKEVVKEPGDKGAVLPVSPGSAPEPLPGAGSPVLYEFDEDQTAKDFDSHLNR